MGCFTIPMLISEAEKHGRYKGEQSTEQTFGLFCTFILYSDIIAKENEDNRFIGGISWIILN